jgi:hypothetical protein
MFKSVFRLQKIVSGGKEGKIFHWVNNKIFGQIGSHTLNVHSVCIANNDENFIFASEEHTVQVANL